MEQRGLPEPATQAVRAHINSTVACSSARTAVMDCEVLSSCKRRYIQAPEETGLYFFHAEAENGEFFSFPWIVAPPPLSSDSSSKQREAKVALLLANMNWNAYNNFGGRSNVRIPFF